MVQDGCGVELSTPERPTTTLFIDVSELKNCRDINSRLTLLNMSADHRNSQLVTAEGALGSGEIPARLRGSGSGVREEVLPSSGACRALFLAPPDSFGGEKFVPRQCLAPRHKTSDQLP